MKTQVHQKSGRSSFKLKPRLIRLITATTIYTALAIYLYQPYFKNFHGLDYLVVINPILAALGCFVLSRRWVDAFGASLFAGIIYGFGTFAICLGTYHPAAGLIFAGLAWLFCPAAFIGRLRLKFGIILTALLCIIPFAIIILFFKTTAAYGLFPLPVQLKLSLEKIFGLLTPLVTKPNSLPLVSFYHAPLAALTMGLFMYFAVRRIGVMIIFLTGTVLAFCNPISHVSPVFWTAVPILCCSVIIGLGTEGIVRAGKSDQRWILSSAAIVAALAITGLVMGLLNNLFFESAKMYALATVAILIISFLARANLRLHWLRWTILCTALGIDIIINARLFVDKIL